jgi:hypothetical protein
MTAAEYRKNEFQSIKAKSPTGHEFGWPYGFYTDGVIIDWNAVTDWCEAHIGSKHHDWSVGRFEILFQRQEHLALFVLTWV